MASEISSAGPTAVAETHSGVVFFVGDRAYKLKKPLDLGFVDFRTPEARLAACRNEVSLNRRIAPDVYLGVADVIGPSGRVCDHLVVMRRMPPDRRLAALIAGGNDVTAELARLAGVLATFHGRCATGLAVERAATRDAQRLRWTNNAAEMERYSGDVVDADVAHEVTELASRYLDGRVPLFDRRIAEGRARDGHGDLLADDIFCLDDGPRVLDCLEFDEQLRFGDVLADVAFLAMDIERLGRADLAARFLREYRAATGDDWPSSLEHHYIAYRAQVRSKVACLRWAQGDAGSRETARQLQDLCLRHLRQGRVRIVLVGGLPGTGKSTVARGIAEETGARLLRSDEIRKELAGLDPMSHVPAPPDEGLYQPALTSATYAEMLTRARRLASRGESVVMDASWLHPEWRANAARVADGTASDLLELRCHAPLDLAVERVERRIRTGQDPSDATPDVVRALAVRDTAWETATVLDTSVDMHQAVAGAVHAVEAADSRAVALRRQAG